MYIIVQETNLKNRARSYHVHSLLKGSVQMVEISGGNLAS